MKTLVGVVLVTVIVSFVSAQWVIRPRGSSNLGAAVKGNKIKLSKDPGKFIMRVPGLSGATDTVTFQSVCTSRVLYVNSKGKLSIKDTNENGFAKDRATFKMSLDTDSKMGQSTGYYTFESVIVPGKFIFRKRRKLVMKSKKGKNSNMKNAGFTCEMVTYLESQNFPSYAWSYSLDEQAKISEENQNRLFLMQPGYSSGLNTVSVCDYKDRDVCLTKIDEGIFAKKLDAVADKRDVTFKILYNNYFDGYFAFEDMQETDCFIRHAGYLLRCNKFGTGGVDLFKNDASFKPRQEACPRG